MRQDAFDLIRLFGGFLFVMALPIVIGLIAVLRERE
jgi:hypothetical protein